jgi:ribosomal-protein-alanine N-acetyltransferase
LNSGDDAFVRALSELAFGEFSKRAGSSTLAMARAHGGVVAERDGRLLGFAVLRINPDGAELAAIAVLEEERGRGIGRALLTACEDAARRAGAPLLMLRTAEANLAAAELFHKRGYRLSRRLPRYYVGVFDALELTKPL